MIWFLLVLSFVNLAAVAWILYRLRIFPKKPSVGLLDQLSRQKQQLDDIFSQTAKIETDMAGLRKDVNLSPLVFSCFFGVDHFFMSVSISSQFLISFCLGQDL